MKLSLALRKLFEHLLSIIHLVCLFVNYSSSLILMKSIEPISTTGKLIDSKTPFDKGILSLFKLMVMPLLKVTYFGIHCTSLCVLL